MVFATYRTLGRKFGCAKYEHRTSEPEWSAFDRVLSREIVRTALTCAAIIELLIHACDFQNAYLQVSSAEKHYVICGTEFRLENVGKHAIIVRTLYGGKSSGADYWSHVRSAMEEMGFS